MNKNVLKPAIIVLLLFPFLFQLLSGFSLRLSGAHQIKAIDRSDNTSMTSLSASLSSTSIEVVIAYFNEDISTLEQTLQRISSTLSLQKRAAVVRYTLYLKDSRVNATALSSKTGINEVVRLRNRGREGSTYLQHILRHYNDSHESQGKDNTSIRHLADLTIFTQPVNKILS